MHNYLKNEIKEQYSLGEFIEIFERKRDEIDIGIKFLPGGPGRVFPGGPGGP